MSKTTMKSIFWLTIQYLAILLMFASFAFCEPATQPSHEQKPAAKATDISALLNNATAKVTVPAGNYTINQPVTLRYSVEFSGSTLTFPLLGNNQSNIRIVSPMVTVNHFIIASGAGTIFESEADRVTISNFQAVATPGAIGQFFKTERGGYNSTITSGHIGQTKTVSVYIDRGAKNPTDAGAIIRDVIFDGVFEGREYPLRFGLPSTGPEVGVIQSRATVLDCQITNWSGTKDTIGVREFNTVTIAGTADPRTDAATATVVGDIRLGQAPGTGAPPTDHVGQWCSGIVIKNVAFTSNGSPMNAVATVQGVTANISQCTFTGYAVPPLTASVFSVVTEGNNIQRTYAGHPAPAFWAASSAGTRVQSPAGSDKSVVIPAPTK